MEFRGLIVVAMLVTAGCTAQDAPPEPAAPAPATPPASTPAMPRATTLKITGWWAWALLDRRTGRITGSPNHGSQTSTTESMIKAWLAADYLAGREPTGQGLGDYARDRIRNALRVSDDAAAEWLYRSRGGDAAIRRMINTCRLTRTSVQPGNWALTPVTARDAARLGGCLADGTASGPRWRDWLLWEMRQIAPSNAFGIRQAFPPEVAGRIAVKNGWTPRSDTGLWHVNCLGLWDHWSLAVLVRYPIRLGLGYGAAACRDVAGQLFSRSGRTGSPAG
jgi:hypothetical protein